MLNNKRYKLINICDVDKIEFEGVIII